MDKCNTDVIIPLYKPDKRFEQLINRLHHQSVKPDRILVVNTGRSFYEEYFGDRDICKVYDDVVVKHIEENEFDHGGTRRIAVTLSDADVIIFMTDDALPADDKLVEKLIAPIVSGEAALSYARQLAGKDADILEKLTRKFNYPAESMLKSSADLKTMGIKAFFCPNVCAAYSRKVYDELGGFDQHMIFNEDMVYARKVIDAGYKIAYVSEAKVFHSHDYNGRQQFKRNFDLGVSHAMHPETFADVPPGGEGMKLVLNQAGQLLKKGRPFKIFKLGWLSACKLAGYKLGKAYKKLPDSMIEKCTMNPVFWRKGG
ncbi:MAG: glycosyltransferase family 2 protein [Lachnospiraceae bacterium]|nr:glycosyltransferase family 2 protein [Lachnospiraceae bacterium]